MSILYTPCSPPHPSPFHRSPNVSVPHCFVLPSPAPLVSCPLCCVLCVRSHMSLDNLYNTKNSWTLLKLLNMFNLLLKTWISVFLDEHYLSKWCWEKQVLIYKWVCNPILDVKSGTDFSWLYSSSSVVNLVSLSKIPMGRNLIWLRSSSSFVSCVSWSKIPLGMDWSLFLSRFRCVSLVSSSNTPWGRDCSLCSTLFSFLVYFITSTTEGWRRLCFHPFLSVCV